MKKNQWLLISLWLLVLGMVMCSKDKPRTLTIKGIELMFVKGGTFYMGEELFHLVRVSDFYIGKTEVTNLQYAAFLNDYGKDTDDYGHSMILESRQGLRKSGSRWEPQPGYENYPVIFVTWYGAAQFAKWAGGRLPTEAEWEYAASSRGKGELWAGTSSESSLGDFAWYRNNSQGQANCVASKKPNGLGLYDMSGNVWEWCSDWYKETYYQNSPFNNPKGPSDGDYRVLRGGDWYDYSWSCRSRTRWQALPFDETGAKGLRVVLDPPH